MKGGAEVLNVVENTLKNAPSRIPPTIMEHDSRLKILPRKEPILNFKPTSNRSQRATNTRVPIYEPGRVSTWLIHELMKEI